MQERFGKRKRIKKRIQKEKKKEEEVKSPQGKRIVGGENKRKGDTGKNGREEGKDDGGERAEVRKP
ncbi:hypothetical protein HID67_07855, partial [Pasteurella multocida]|uniref:hypothetical protein n=1 Tax=Pasteurella multocida TaxID=747 RepID=UPI0014613A57